MKPIIIKAKYPGTCVYCGCEVEIGETVAWVKDEGVVHTKHFSSEQLQRESLIEEARRGVQ